MTENLRLTGQRTLTPSDSNVSSNWTLPAVNETFPTPCEDVAYNMKSSTDATTYASYGNYYNWYAATAGTGTCAMESGNATASICPKGWRLPTSDSDGEFQSIYNQYGSSALIQEEPASLLLSGRQFGSNTESQGEVGYYWSSTVHSANNAYNLNLNSTNVNPVGNNRKYLGFAMRCIAQ